MTTTVNISVTPGRVYKLALPAGVDAYYANQKVGGSGTLNTFIAIQGVSVLTLESVAVVSGNVVLTEILRSYYESDDGQGDIWCFKPGLEGRDGWKSRYSFRPEWMTNILNRLVSFKSGMPYIHDGAVNTFYGQVFDTVIAVAHSEDGNSIKSYRAVAIEGDTPDRVHTRTEIPYEQSTDLIAGDFTVKEGVNYAALLRDRLSPNAAGTYNQKMYTGDTIRGEASKTMVVYREPSQKKELKFINIDFDPSTGQTV